MFKKISLLLSLMVVASGVRCMDVAVKPEISAEQRAKATTELHRLINELPSGQENNPEVLKQVQLLLGQGADPNPQKPLERPLLTKLLEENNSNPELFSLLIKAKADPFVKGRTRDSTDRGDSVSHLCTPRRINYTYPEKYNTTSDNWAKIRKIFAAYLPTDPAPPAPPAPLPAPLLQAVTAGATPQGTSSGVEASSSSSSAASDKGDGKSSAASAKE